jgi:predicted alpha/beta-fold hydrolase
MMVRHLVTAGDRLLAPALLAFAAATAFAATADVARETRWADQVVPQIVVGEAVWLATPRHPRVLALYTEPAKPTREAVIVVHGMGVNPDWNLIGVLRTELADRGFATLSVQMPVLAADAPRDDYAALHPDAGERLASAVAWLQGRGHARIAVVSHSMGSAMVDAWLAHSQPRVEAWVPVGMMVPFAAAPRQPVLDVVAERDFPEALSAAKARKPQLPRDACSGSLVVGNADHYFGDAASRLVDAIAPFIARALGGSCQKP